MSDTGKKGEKNSEKSPGPNGWKGKLAKSRI